MANQIKRKTEEAETPKREIELPLVDEKNEHEKDQQCIEKYFQQEMIHEMDRENPRSPLKIRNICHHSTSQIKPANHSNSPFLLIQ
jgi:hypothetical protein